MSVWTAAFLGYVTGNLPDYGVWLWIKTAASIVFVVLIFRLARQQAKAGPS